MRWSPFIEGLWIARSPVDHAWRTITGVDEMKQNELIRLMWRNGKMKFLTEEYGRNTEKTYPDSVSSTTKPTCIIYRPILYIIIYDISSMKFCTINILFEELQKYVFNFIFTVSMQLHRMWIFLSKQINLGKSSGKYSWKQWSKFYLSFILL